MGSGPGGPSIFFLVSGIVINVALTAAAIWWVLKQGRRKNPPREAPPQRREGNDA